MMTQYLFNIVISGLNYQADSILIQTLANQCRMPNGYSIPIECYKFLLMSDVSSKEKIIHIQLLFSIVVSMLTHQR